MQCSKYLTKCLEMQVAGHLRPYIMYSSLCTKLITLNNAVLVIDAALTQKMNTM